MYSPAPGMYNVGSIFGKKQRFRRNGINKGGVISKMDKQERDKYKKTKKSYKEFDHNLLNRRSHK